MLGIQNANKDGVRKRAYADLLKVANKALSYGKNVLEQIKAKVFLDPQEASGLARELERFIPVAKQVIDQTERRVMGGEKVPASEKVVSLFEPYTDIIVKDRRDTFYGHKVCLSSGPSNLITDCLITEGNPADSTLTLHMLERHESVFGRYPLKAALDGGFVSKANLGAAKERGVKDVCFAKKRGLRVEDMCRSEYAYDRLRRFRAGIESGISRLKRCFGFAKCTRKGLSSFKSYVWVSIVSANLVAIAKHLEPSGAV